MNINFDYNLFGLTVKVACTLTKGEPATFDCPGYDDTCDIETITHANDEVNVSLLPEDEIASIEKAAFKFAKNEEC